jgi:hypothetical protein
MRRRAFFQSVLVIVAVTFLVCSTLIYLVLDEPATYQLASVTPGKDRKKLSGECVSRYFRLMDTISNRTESWMESFSADQINSYFAEDMIKQNHRWLPDEIHSPRVAFDTDRIQIAFRYGHGFWSSVITVDLKLWLVENEPNVICIELRGLKAGALPISPHFLLEPVGDAAQQHNIDVQWFRHDGNPIAVVRLQADQTRPTVLLRRLELQSGEIILEGLSNEFSATRGP